MGGDYENTLISLVTYVVSPQGTDLAPAPPLEEDKTYTSTVVRKDPKGEGDGFSNMRHRYVGKITFVAAVEYILFIVGSCGLGCWFHIDPSAISKKREPAIRSDQQIEEVIAVVEGAGIARDIA